MLSCHKPVGKLKKKNVVRTVEDAAVSCSFYFKLLWESPPRIQRQTIKAAAPMVTDSAGADNGALTWAVDVMI